MTINPRGRNMPSEVAIRAPGVLVDALKRRQPSIKDTARFIDRSVDQAKRLRAGKMASIPFEYFAQAAAAYGWQFVHEVLEPLLGPSPINQKLEEIRTRQDETLSRMADLVSRALPMDAVVSSDDRELRPGQPSLITGAVSLTPDSASREALDD